MNLDFSKWKPFTVGKLFHIEYGRDMELTDYEEGTGDETYNFVSRTRENNGVSAHIYRPEDIVPQPKGTITVAGGGSSVLSTFVQEEDFYSGYHLFVLTPIIELSKETKMFITTVIEKNKFRYSFGRQANKTLPTLELLLPAQYNGETPIIDATKQFSEAGFMPDWKFMEDYIKSIHHKPLTTQNRSKNRPTIDMQKWKEFRLPSLFEIEAGIYYNSEQYEEGKTPYISASGTNNGIGRQISLNPDFSGNKITIGKLGAKAYYQPSSFCATCDVNILTPKFDMNRFHGLFIVSMINFSENYKWDYGRQCRVGDTKEITIKLPVLLDKSGIPIKDSTCKYSSYGYIPDWDFPADKPYQNKRFPHQGVPNMCS